TSGEADTSRMRRDGLPDEGQQSIAKDLAVERARVLPQLDGIPGNVLSPADGVDQAVDLLTLEQHAGLSVGDGIERTASSIRDDRSSTGIGLQRRDAEIFFTRKHEAAAARVQLLQLGIRDVADELHVAAGASP